jgi:preprotein translocase SecE subunit
VKKILGYFSEVKLELTKVTWPGRADIIRLTLIVLAISAIVGLFSGGLDFLFTKMLSIFVVK